MISPLFSFLFFLYFSSRGQTIVPRAFHSAKNTLPSPNQTAPSTARNQTGNQPSPGTIPPSSTFGLGLQCNIDAINPRTGRRKNAAESSGSRERRKGDSAFMRLALLVGFSCRGEFIDGDKRFFGREAIFRPPCMACRRRGGGGEKKGRGRRTN